MPDALPDSGPTPEALEAARDVRVELLQAGIEGNGAQLPAGTLAIIALALDAFRREGVEKDRPGWINVPQPGTVVRSSHPITVLNPEPTFEVLSVKEENGRFYVRGEKTCWFGISMITPVEA